MDTTTRNIPADWDITDPESWGYTTTVDAHLGWHATGMVVRELRTIVHNVSDWGADDIEPTAEHAAWWAAVLAPIHAAEVAVAEADPETLDRALTALGIPAQPDEPISHRLAAYWSADDLEGTAAEARALLAAITEHAS